MDKKNEQKIITEIAERYNPVDFGEGEVTKEDLEAIMLAATMAPSAYGEQPWRFFVATSEEDRSALLEYMTPGNANWAQKAPVLIAIAGYIYGTKDHTFNYWSGFDSGAAWSCLALEAQHRGYAAGFIGSFDRHDIKREFALEDEDFYDFYAIVALGRPSAQEPRETIVPKSLEQVSLVRKIKQKNK